MSVFNKIKTELVILLIITLNIFISFDIDLAVHNYFQTFNLTTGGTYLKSFFIAITKLGSSSWYFGISVFFIILLYTNKRFKIINIKNTDGLIKFFISIFFYLLAIGVLTQIGKHIIGRPRPNYTNFEDGLSFNFFTFESSLHSFPSGHASTIFMICFIFCAVLPKLKYFFYFLASVVALSRVIVGAHFFTDILAGAVLALIVFKILNNLFKNNYKNFVFTGLVVKNNIQLYYSIIFLLISSLFLTIGPTLDIYISSLFYYGNSQFLLQSYDIVSKIFREWLLPFLIIYILILPILGSIFKVEKIFFGYKFSTNEIFLIWLSQVIVVLVFVNLILKNLWGRSRPGDITQLGGKEVFTPWYEFGNACNVNCSFVSGDASVGFSIIILYFITKNILFVYFSLIFGFLLGFIRIIAGGHFLSDILLAGLLVIFLNMIIFKFYKKYYEQ